MSYLLDYNPGTQQWGFPRRGAVLSGTCIVHTAECAADNVGEDASAEGCARMIANRADYGSYHRLVDSDSIIDMLPFEYEAWQDSETNPWAVGISAALRTSDWAVMPTDRRERVYRNLALCAAEFVRHMAGKGIAVPLRRITGAEARARVPGFCAHGDSGIARSDPGANFDWNLFFQYTQEALGSGAIAPAGTTSVPVQEDELSQQEVERIINEVGTIIAQHHKVTRETVTGTGGEVKELVKDRAVFVAQENVKVGESIGRVTQKLILDTRTPAVMVEQIVAAGIAKEVVDLLTERLAS